jgi:hypothetical protein
MSSLNHLPLILSQQGLPEHDLSSLLFVTRKFRDFRQTARATIMRFRSNSHLYEKVSGGDDSKEPSEGSSTPPTSLGRRKESWLSGTFGTIFIALVTAIITACISTIVVSHRTSSSTERAHSNVSLPANEPSMIPEPSLKNGGSLEIKGCGSNPAEARALGCVYDVMMQDWTPAECYDSVLTENYLAKNNWTWWADSGAERAMSDEEVALGEHSVVYVAQDYHVKHCIFAWEKFVRAFRTQSPLITELISYDHVIHCRDHTLLPALDKSKHIRGVVAPTGYTHCASYDVWINALPENTHSSTD